MRTILYVLLSMILVNDDVLQYVIRDARMQNEETDELSSDVDNFEEFPRFVGVADFDRQSRATHVSEAHKNTRLRKNKRHLTKNHRNHNNLAKKHRKQKKVRRKQINQQLERIHLRGAEVQPAVHELTTCIVISERTNDLDENSTTEEILETTTEQIMESTTVFENDEISTTDVNLETTTETTIAETIVAETTTTESFIFSSTSETTVLPTSPVVINTENIDTESGIKIFDVKLVCKVGKYKNDSNLEKVNQCYFGSTDGVSFYMPTLQKSIFTEETRDHFPSIPELSANNTWRLIEATGVKTKIIEKVGNKKIPESLKPVRKMKKRVKRRLKKRKG